MSENQHPTQPTVNGAPLDSTEEAPKKRRGLKTIGVLTVGLLGIGLGAATGGGGDNEAAPTETVTATATAEAPDNSAEVEKLEAALDERTDQLHAVTEERDELNAQLEAAAATSGTPAVCADALDKGEEVMVTLARLEPVMTEYSQFVPRLMEGVEANDPSIINELLVADQALKAEYNDIVENLETQTADYRALADECLGAGA